MDAILPLSLSLSGIYAGAGRVLQGQNAPRPKTGGFWVQALFGAGEKKAVNCGEEQDVAAACPISAGHSRD